MTIRYVSRFRSGVAVSIGAVLFSLVGLRDFEHYAFAWMDSGFYWPIIKLASAHLLDCELGERSSRLELSTALQSGRPFTQLTVKKMRGRKFDNRPVKTRIHPSKGIVFEVPKTHKGKQNSAN